MNIDLSAEVIKLQKPLSERGGEEHYTCDCITLEDTNNMFKSRENYTHVP